MAAQHDPKLLYSIRNIKAYHIQDGQEQPLTPSGPQTLSLLMVPTNSPYADLDTNEDFYLHMNLPPELDLPMPATTQIYHQPPSSYLIPRWDLGPDSGAFTRIEFPRVGYGVTQEDVDTFETILAQCTAFLERAKPPLPGRPGEKGGSAYNPADYAQGGSRYPNEKDGATGGQIVLVDEDNGSVVGELDGGAQVIEDSKLRHGTKDPVEVQMSADGKRIAVRPMTEDYLDMAKHPAYAKSTLVQRSATASRLIVTGSSYIGNALTSGADNFTKKTAPAGTPMQFKESTHERVRKINTFTQSAAGLSSKTVGQLTSLTQNFAARASGHTKNRPNKGYDVNGNPLGEEEYKPGLLNKSMIAFSTIADGIAYGGKNLLSTSGAAASQVVGHRYGQEAGDITANLAGGVKNVGLVYIDVTGVSRRAVIKSVAKGMVVGKVRGGGEVVVGGGDGGDIPAEDLKRMEAKQSGQAYPVSGGGTGYGGPPAGGYAPQGGQYTGAPPRYEESSYGSKR